MIQLAANLTTMFQEFDAIEARCQAAAKCGFLAVEILNPYNEDAEELKHHLEVHNLEAILINVKPGNTGEAGIAAIPGREREFADDFERALAYAKTLGAPMIHVLAGRATADQALSNNCFIQNLQMAADLARDEGITLNLEPLNHFDVPDYLHSKCAETAALISDISRTNVKLQFDLYHLQRMEGNLVNLFQEHQSIISHVQLSSVPGRQEPHYGEVNAHFVLDALDALGYSGWVGCEYWPRAGTQEGLSWAKGYGIHT